MTGHSAGIEPVYLDHYVRRRKMGDNKASHFLSKVLRHDPAAANVTLDAQGWADIDALIVGSGGRVTREALDAAVAENDKQRFAISEDGKRIRARQGHTVPVELGLKAEVPPEVLYHGTYPDAVKAILREGLQRMKRHHVHMAKDSDTANAVGRRKGAPVLLQIEANAMHAAGHKFYQSENGVWLTEHVPPEYLKVVW